MSRLRWELDKLVEIMSKEIATQRESAMVTLDGFTDFHPERMGYANGCADSLSGVKKKLEKIIKEHCEPAGGITHNDVLKAAIVQNRYCNMTESY